MGDRALAHIERILTTYPIENADNIEMAQVLDFHVAVKKNEFSKNDLVVYVEVDSILPDGLPDKLKAELKEKQKELKIATGDRINDLENEIQVILSKNLKPEFEFLRKKQFTIKALKYSKFKIISMGIIFPLSILPKNIVPKVGLDVTEALGIAKVVEDVEEEKPKTNRLHKFLFKYKFYRSLFRKTNPINGSWQQFFPSQSDEENVQKIFSKFKHDYNDKTFYVAEKMEGQNMSLVLYKYKTFGFKRTLFGVCSRTRFIKTPDDSQFWKTTRQLDLENKVRKINRSLFIRGEHCGGKIMKNIYKFPEHKFLVFEIFDFEANRFFNYEELKAFCIKYDFDMVPVLDENFKLKDNVQDMLNYSNGKSYYGKTLREGVVIRDKEYPKISFKIRSPEYLVK